MDVSVSRVWVWVWVDICICIHIQIYSWESTHTHTHTLLTLTPTPTWPTPTLTPTPTWHAMSYVWRLWDSWWGIQFVLMDTVALHRVCFFWWVLQHCTGFARLVWGRLRVHRAFVYSDWFVCSVWRWWGSWWGIQLGTYGVATVRRID